MIIMGVLGLLVGSFTNVLIWRLPRHESIAFPPSHCPNCNHPLAVKDLVPLFSWLALRGKCRYCHAPISPRYPVVEAITGLAYATIALFFPISVAGAGLLGLCFFFTILLAASVIDAETYTIPDALTIPGVILGLIFAGVATYQGTAAAAGMATALPGIAQAVQGALMGAGVLVTIDLFGSWVLRRFRERQYPSAPIDYQQISLSLFVGALVGGLLHQPWSVAAMAGLLAAVVSTGANIAAKKVIRLPEFITLGGTLLLLTGLSALGGSNLGNTLLELLYGMLAGAGAASMLAGVYWWARASDIDEDSPSDASAMGFGDVKLAAVIGAFLGFGNVLLSIGVAIAAGAILGIIQRLVVGENRLKFGPYLALGALVAMLWGQPIIAAYRQWMHLG